MNGPQRFLTVAGLVAVSLMLHLALCEWKTEIGGEPIITLGRNAVSVPEDPAGRAAAELLVKRLNAIRREFPGLLTDDMLDKVYFEYFGIYPQGVSGATALAGGIVAPFGLLVAALVIALGAVGGFNLLDKMFGPDPSSSQNETEGHDARHR